MSVRSKGREIALQILYQFDLFEKHEVDEALKSYIAGFEEEDKPLRKSSISFARERINLVLSHKDEIDRVINQHATHWKLGRMASIDRNILRLGVSELCFCPDVPPKVAINEALELAKRYGSDESSPFVNGILDGIYKKRVKGQKGGDAGRSDD